MRSGQLSAIGCPLAAGISLRSLSSWAKRRISVRIVNERMLLYTGWHEDIRRQTAEGCIPESRGGREAAYILIAAGDTTPSEPSYNMFGRGRLEDLSLLDISPLQHEHAFGIMVIGAIEDIPLNPV